MLKIMDVDNSILPLARINSLTEDLLSHDLSESDLCQMMAMKTLNFLDITSVYMVELNANGMVRTTATFGAYGEFEQNVKEFSIGSKVPVTDTLRLNRMVWINSLPDWSKDYPLMNEVIIDNEVCTHISFPIRRYGAPVGAIGIFSTTVLYPDPELETLLLTVGNLIAYYLYSKARGKTLKPVLHNIKGLLTPLTDRQKQVLNLMSEGKTNAAIANILGYSESTVRQETVRVFLALGVGTRSAAMKMYLERPQDFQ